MPCLSDFPTTKIPQMGFVDDYESDILIRFESLNLQLTKEIFIKKFLGDLIQQKMAAYCVTTVIHLVAIHNF